MFVKIQNMPLAPEEWLIPKEALIAIAILNNFDKDKRLVIECGVLHGAWSLNILRNVESTSVLGIDPFPNLNKMRSQTLQRFRDLSFSLYSGWSECVIGSSASMIHIDGLHTELAVYDDLRQAENYLSDDGIIIVDDYLSPIFPGVASGFFKFLHESDFAPFLATGSKIYITQKKNYLKWHSYLVESLEGQDVIKWCNYLGEGENVPYISWPDVNGFRVILSFDRTDPIPGNKLLDSWPSQPNFDLVQRVDN